MVCVRLRQEHGFTESRKIESASVMVSEATGAASPRLPALPPVGHRAHGTQKGVASPLFPCRERSRTAILAVLTGQGRYSSCKMWERVLKSRHKAAFSSPFHLAFRADLGSFPEGVLSMRMASSLKFHSTVLKSAESQFRDFSFCQTAASPFGSFRF